MEDWKDLEVDWDMAFGSGLENYQKLQLKLFISP